MFLYNRKIETKPLSVLTEEHDFYQEILTCKTNMVNKLADITLEYYRGIYEAHGNKKILTEAITDSYTAIKALFDEFITNITNLLDKWSRQIKDHADKILATEAVRRFKELQNSNFNFGNVDFTLDPEEDYFSYNNTYTWFGGNHAFTNLMATEKVTEFMKPESLKNSGLAVTFDMVYGLSTDDYSKDLAKDKIEYDLSVDSADVFLKRIESVGTFLDEMNADVYTGLKDVSVKLENTSEDENLNDTLAHLVSERFVTISDILTTGTTLFLQGVDASLTEYSRIIISMTKMMEFARINNLQ